eukprot:273991-Hanusia_phi.AAC.1
MDDKISRALTYLLKDMESSSVDDDKLLEAVTVNKAAVTLQKYLKAMRAAHFVTGWRLSQRRFGSLPLPRPPSY